MKKVKASLETHRSKAGSVQGPSLNTCCIRTQINYQIINLFSLINDFVGVVLRLGDKLASLPPLIRVNNVKGQPNPSSFTQYEIIITARLRVKKYN